MELDTSYFTEAADEFELRCPMWAEQAYKYIPKHNHIIRVLLRNGDCVDYNNREGTFRYIVKDKIPNSDDLTDESCRSAFALNLSEIMMVRGISQSVLAERTGISQGMISNYLKEKSTPTMPNIKKIARVLQCSPYELME